MPGNGNALALRLLLAAIGLGALAASCAVKKAVEQKPAHEDLRPWQSAEERTAFMFALARMVDPEADTNTYCIDRIHREREAQKKGVHFDARLQENTSLDSRRQNFYADSRNHYSNGTGTPAGIVLVQAAEAADPCEPALRTCGNCHLPRANDCQYVITYLDAEDKPVSTPPRSVAITDTASIGIVAVIEYLEGEIRRPSTDDDLHMKIPIDRIIKTTWINGAEPLITWWDFERFNKRGEMAHKMLSIAAEHNVACTNCHLRHGDFRLTGAGEEFFRSGRVIRNEPLRQMFVEN
jgi:hypothetical protein